MFGQDEMNRLFEWERRWIICSLAVDGTGKIRGMGYRDCCQLRHMDSSACLDASGRGMTLNPSRQAMQALIVPSRMLPIQIKNSCIGNFQTQPPHPPKQAPVCAQRSPAQIRQGLSPRNCMAHKEISSINQSRWSRLDLLNLPVSHLRQGRLSIWYIHELVNTAAK